MDIPVLDLLAFCAVLAFCVWAFKGRGLRRAPPAPPSHAMSLDEARSILGVGPTASAEEIRSAYRRLMRRVHPDHGGASGLAAQLNAARDRLTRP